MHRTPTTARTRLRGLLAAITTCAVLAPAATAVAVNWNVYPYNHWPEADAKPGTPGHIAPTPTTAQPPVGMSDDQLRATDPRGYREIVQERARIERKLLARARRTVDEAGIPRGKRLTAVQAEELADDLSAAAVSPYGYTRFGLVPGSGDWCYNGYRGTFYFVYGIYNATTDSYRWFTVSWPAISGSNKPADQSKVGVGPIPEYTYDFGFINALFQGYVADVRDEFYAGKWRLDPWTGAPYGRSYLETHGGRNASYFRPTSGCVRLTPTSISTVKTYYDTKMANKRSRSSAHLIVNY